VRNTSNPSGGSLENAINGNSLKSVPKNMRIRETPIRVRKGGLNKVMLRKNSNGTIDPVGASHSHV
jgi:hypothetical protein